MKVDRHSKIVELIEKYEIGTQEELTKALLAEGFDHLYHAGSMEEAVRLCQEKSQDGWNVLLSPACASFDMFHDYEERGRVFKEIVNHLA